MSKRVMTDQECEEFCEMLRKENARMEGEEKKRRDKAYQDSHRYRYTQWLKYEWRHRRK